MNMQSNSIKNTMEKLKNDQVTQHQPVHDEERPIHLMDLYYRLMVPILQQEVKSLNQTVDIYKGFNWGVLKTQEEQRSALSEMKEKLDSALEEIQNLRRAAMANSSKVAIAESFLKGSAHADELAKALYSGSLSKFVGVNVQIKKEPVTIPNLNDLSNEMRER